MERRDSPLRRLADWCIVLSILAFTLVQLFSHYNFSKEYLVYLRFSEQQTRCVNAAYNYLETTNSLSTDMCQYAFTGEEEYLTDYFRIMNSKDRISAETTLQTAAVDRSFTDTVMKESDRIFRLEMHILKLAAVANSVPDFGMDQKVRDWELTDEELALSQEEQMLLASELAFSDEYRITKMNFGVALKDFADELISSNEVIQAQYINLIQEKTSMQQTMLFLTAILMLLIVVLLYRQMMTINTMLVNEQQFKGALVTDAIGVFEVNLTEDRIESILSEKDKVITNELKRMKLTVPCPFSEFMAAVVANIPPVEAVALERFSAAYLINQYNSDNRFITRENWYTPADDRHLYLRNTILLSKRPDSESVYGLIVFRDITSEKLEYEKQRQLVEISFRSAQQYLDALRTDSIGIYESNITNGTIDHIISDTADHALGRFFEAANIVLPGKVGQYREAVLPLIDEGQRDQMITDDSELLTRMYEKGVRNQITEFWITLPDGTRKFLKNTMLLRKAEGSGDLLAIVIIKDYTKQQLEIEARQMELLQQKASNEAKTKFFSSMSHDIRTPLNGVIGMIDLVRHHMDEPERVRDYMEKIDQSSKHLLSLVNDVLDMSAIDSGKVEIAKKPVNLQAVLDECFVIVNSQLLMRDIVFEVNNAELKTPVVLSDPVALKKIVMNILSNAIKFTGDGGRITFTSEYGYSFDGTKLNAKYVIADTGIGMSEEFQKKLFDPFAQENTGARTNYQGTGLGMSIVKQYVDILGGTITVDSEKGKGSSFTVELPLEISKGGEDGLVEVETSLIDVKDLKVLLVDDNELNIEIVQMLLEDAGAIVTTASNGREAVDAFTNAEEGSYNAIIMDIMMPIMDGIEATKAIRRMAMNRKDAADIPIIALTANAFAADLKKTEEAGMTAHLSKPIVPNMLMETLTRCCRRS